MIFRTGSVLIVGMCDEYVLQDIYHFLKSLLKAESKVICNQLISEEDKQNKNKKKKIRKKIIHIVTNDEYGGCDNGCDGDGETESEPEP